MSQQKMTATINVISNSPQELERQLQEIVDRIREGSIGGTDATPAGGSYKFEAVIPEGW